MCAAESATAARGLFSVLSHGQLGGHAPAAQLGEERNLLLKLLQLQRETVLSVIAT